MAEIINIKDRYTNGEAVTLYFSFPKGENYVRLHTSYYADGTGKNQVYAGNSGAAFNVSASFTSHPNDTVMPYYFILEGCYQDPIDTSSIVVKSTKTYTFDIVLPSSSKPTMNVIVQKNNKGILNGKDVFAKDCTSVVLILSARGYMGSTIQSYSTTLIVENNGTEVQRTSTTTQVSTIPITGVGTARYECTATDSRGRTVVRTGTIGTVQNYVPATLTQFDAIRGNAEGTQWEDNPAGDYVKFTINGVCGFTDYGNKLNGKLVVDGGDPETFTVDSETENVFIKRLSINSEHDIKIYLKDLIQTTYPTSYFPKIIPAIEGVPLALNFDDGCVAVGGVPQASGKFDVFYDMESHGSFGSHIKAKLSGNQTISGSSSGTSTQINFANQNGKYLSVSNKDIVIGKNVHTILVVCQWTSPGADQKGINIFKNTDVVSYTTMTGRTCTTSCLIDVAEGDHIKIMAVSYNASGETINGSEANTFMQVITLN